MGGRSKGERRETGAVLGDGKTRTTRSRGVTKLMMKRKSSLTDKTRLRSGAIISSKPYVSSTANGQNSQSRLTKKTYNNASG
jgi:hypothetical protein